MNKEVKDWWIKTLLESPFPNPPKIKEIMKLMKEMMSEDFLKEWAKGNGIYISHPIRLNNPAKHIIKLAEDLQKDNCVFFPWDNRWDITPSQRFHIDVMLCTSAKLLIWDLSYPSIGASSEASYAFFKKVKIIGILPKNTEKGISDFAKYMCSEILEYKKDINIRKYMLPI